MMTGRAVLMCVALLAVALYAGNLAGAGSGPPTDRPEWHLRWAAGFFGVSVAAVIAIGAVIVRVARAARRRFT